MPGKAYKAIEEKIPQTASAAQAVAFLKDSGSRGFDETFELHVHLGVDLSKSDQIVRGSLQLPGGSPSKKVIAVFTEDKAQQKAAKDAGASIIGGEDLIETITKAKTLKADVAVATPDMMPHLAKIARILGPKGLMPNPKIGTVTPNIAAAVKDLTGGKISFKMDSQGNIHESVGKVSWDAEKVVANIEALLDAISTARPANAKGEFIKTATVCLTMSPGVRITTS